MLAGGQTIEICEAISMIAKTYSIRGAVINFPIILIMSLT